MKPTASSYCEIAGRLMRHAAVPYHEDAVRDEVEQLCRAGGLAAERDRFGNVLVRLQTAPQLRPVVLAAHLDHPGFEVIRPLGGRKWLARFLGGVPGEYFRAGVPMRLLPGAVPAKLGGHAGKKGLFQLVAVRKPETTPRFAVWELPGFARRGQHIFGRACDDLGGVAAILTILFALKKSRAKVNVIGVLSRAEEVGFHGALTVGAGGRLPKNALVISLETSRELPPVKMGRGVIIRVGDRSSIFDSAATRFLTEVAGGLKQHRRDFRFQRALMSGGTCEGTAYQELGFQTAAVCVALGNYHNCASRNRIGVEYIHIGDAVGMVDLLSAAIRRMPAFERLTGRLPARLNRMLGEARERLG